tara:strand:- start:308 stop:538 length:231 start_codon:yes stop_codon:yes gene_type:complete
MIVVESTLRRLIRSCLLEFRRKFKSIQNYNSDNWFYADESDYEYDDYDDYADEDDYDYDDYDDYDEDDFDYDDDWG